ncbi:MAG: NUDIX domain-containing protein [Fuerstiella sp.]
MKDGVAAVVFDDEKENVLLVKRRDVPIWVLPGGGIDPGESPEQAAVREVQEESGLEVRIVRKVAVYTPTGKLTSETHLFECAVVSGEPCVSDESMDVGVFPIGSYPPPVFDVHNGWLKDTCENRPELIVKPVEGLDWRNLLKAIIQHPILSSRFLLTKIGLRWNS